MGGVAWTEEEDQLLMKCIEQYGEGKWHRVPLLAGLKRCRKSCRLRWLNYLRPNIRRGSFMSDEIDIIIKLHQCFGNKWSLIASKLSGRTANDVKNYWHCHLSKVFNKRDNGDNSVTNIQRESSGSKQGNDTLKSSKDSSKSGGEDEGHKVCIKGDYDEVQNVVNSLEDDMEYDLEVFGNDTSSVTTGMDESFCGLGKWDLDELPIDLGLWLDSV